MATIEIDEQVARDWIRQWDTLAADGEMNPMSSAYALRSEVTKALPPELEVGWHVVTWPNNDLQYSMWWDGEAWSWTRDGSPLNLTGIKSVTHLGQ